MNLRKRIITIVLVVLIVAGCAAGGGWAWSHRAKKEVNVYSLSDGFAMTDYWGDSSQTEGMVTIEGLQNVYLTDTQTVKEVLVQEGQQVHKGDVLLTYDTTLTEIDVKKKDITVQQLELQLTEAQKELARVKSYRPNKYIPGSVTTFVIPGVPAPQPEPFMDDGTLILLGGSGSSDDPFTYVWSSSYAFDDAFLYQCMRGERDCYVRFLISGSGETVAHVHTPDDHGWYSDENGHWHICAVCGEKMDEYAHTENGGWHSDKNGHWHVCDVCKEKYDEQDHDFWRVTDKLPDIGVKGHWYEQCTVCGKKGSEGSIDAIEAPEQPDNHNQDDNNNQQDGNNGQDAGTQGDNTSDQSDSGNQSSPTPASTGTQYQGELLFQMQHDDSIGGYQIQLISIDVPSTDEWAKLPLFQWSDGNPLPELPEPVPVEDIPAQRITDGIKYTAEELNAMVQEAESKVRELDLLLRQAKLEYEKAERELNNGAIVSELDGKVTGLMDAEAADSANEPVLRVTAGGGYYIQGTLSELELDVIRVGQSVTINSWMSGAECEGTIVDISEYPSGGYNWGDGNSNVSYYPFTVFVTEDAGLREGEYVEIQYSPAESEAGFYLESMFIRSENGRSYVYVQGADGTLEKRYISTGRALWGSYTQVRSGITPEDCLAFPYGSDVVEGAPTVLATQQQFYGR